MNCTQHDFPQWSSIIQISDYFVQRRYCIKCNYCEQREVKIK